MKHKKLPEVTTIPLSEMVFPDQYYLIKDKWELDARETWRSLTSEKRITEASCTFLLAFEKYVLRFNFHIVYDNEVNIPADIETIMELLPEVARPVFQNFVDIYMAQKPVRHVEAGSSMSVASFEPPFLIGPHIVGIYLVTTTIGRIPMSDK